LSTAAGLTEACKRSSAGPRRVGRQRQASGSSRQSRTRVPRTAVSTPAVATCRVPPAMP